MEEMEILKTFVEKIDVQEELPSEIAEIVDENFFEML